VDDALLQRITKARGLVERFGDRSPPHFSLGRALHDAGDWSGAEVSYNEAARLQPDLLMAWLHRAECLLEIGRLDDAAACATHARNLAKSQGHSGPLAEADELLDAIAEQKDD
jgi:tetratricopeptide (TPR) repeat protein